LRHIVLLDSGPVGLLAVPGEHGAGGEARRWLGDLLASGATILVADVVAFEVRRELKRRKATAKLARLELALLGVGRAEHTAAAWVRAEDLWALVRQDRLPTAPDEALDGDCLLGATVAALGAEDDQVEIATMNVRHFDRFPGVVAREWREIR
jgi:predicted nucleic acid-binding protein